MKALSTPLCACLALVLGCLVWVGGITWAIMYFLGLSAFAGWCIAGSLGASAAVAVTFIVYEMKHAVEWSELDEPADIERSTGTSHLGTSLGTGSLPEGAAPSFQVPNKSC